ncbi:MAG: ribose-phosphate pyrophosphokinase [Bdellovibrionaceae bacterium]|jgi:ribose-phosphate pyrophosphokinase|nr:ribose-phosphate pyrophosphokinase [Pseudobdellovibrionaceae bacterium]
MKNLRLISGNASPVFAAKVAEHCGVTLCDGNISTFADGEIQVEIHESIRGKDVFVIQSTCTPTNNNLMELFLILDACQRASANSITAVIPYYGYARQDRKVAPRAPISAKCVADLVTAAGADRVVSIDLHSAQIQGFFNCPVDHLYAIPTLAKMWKEKMGESDEYVIVSPDAGGVERVRAFAKRIGAPIAIIDKRRTGPNEAKALHLIGDVEGKTAVIVDDMIDTAGTLVQAVDSLLKNGAKRVFAVATHPLFSGPAMSRLNESAIEKIFVTDTIPLNEEAKKSNKIEVVSVAPVVAEAISRIYSHDSVSSLFN